MKTLILLAALALCGCARFSTTQTDKRTNATTGETTEITTKAASGTFFASKSTLNKWKATQSEKSQGAEVGGLAQTSDAAESLKAMIEILKLVRPTP